ncbi:hypothetical protein ACO2IY_20380, partial [Leptospira interrogans]
FGIKCESDYYAAIRRKAALNLLFAPIFLHRTHVIIGFEKFYLTVLISRSDSRFTGKSYFSNV